MGREVGERVLVGLLLGVTRMERNNTERYSGREKKSEYMLR